MDISLMYLYPSLHLWTYGRTCLPAYLPTYLPICKEIYYKELAHAIMELKQSHDLLSADKEKQAIFEDLRAQRNHGIDSRSES